MEQKLIKSRMRVRKHGEVFTPAWMVEKMLNVEGITESCNTIDATFLEPAAGEGNFLMAILERKLTLVKEQYSPTLAHYENYALFALSTLYGIELLEDNTQMCVMNLIEVNHNQCYIIHGKEPVFHPFHIGLIQSACAFVHKVDFSIIKQRSCNSKR